jgi:hypothetical protein
MLVQGMKSPQRFAVSAAIMLIAVVHIELNVRRFSHTLLTTVIPTQNSTAGCEVHYTKQERLAFLCHSLKRTFISRLGTARCPWIQVQTVPPRILEYFWKHYIPLWFCVSDCYWPFLQKRVHNKVINRIKTIFLHDLQVRKFPFICSVSSGLKQLPSYRTK